MEKEKVAKTLGITMNKLKRIFGGSAGVAAAEQAKLIIEHDIESALIKKACGYSYTEVKETEKSGGVEVTTTHKEVAPDTSAAKTWLENRCPENWNSKNEKSSDEKLDEIFKGIDSFMSDK